MVGILFYDRSSTHGVILPFHPIHPRGHRTLFINLIFLIFPSSILDLLILSSDFLEHWDKETEGSPQLSFTYL